MAVLQAFADDSARRLGDQRLYVAGYLNSSYKWDLFAKAWAEELRSGLAIQRLKMADAFALNGEFRDFTPEQRAEKLRGLVRVIQHFRPISFEVSVSVADYRRLVTPAAPRGVGSPHFPCCFGVVSSVAGYAARSQTSLPIHFTFDQQDGVDVDLRL
ncbi:MAG: hypothetical protein WDO56_28260 [Gammaproteobacteria bacterium]